ncbi:kinase domain protein (macronuclear) [Tetrahymena thermophila SB210]|uniref:Kinase domain protein n=1 Tax=Tetrahymena thermophila (strain SB210) TaxID=312017 RepID=W7XGC5_TETTS|nr:kinase domain protein [Tetrahymena thermophila SB210]EWS71924.1 kinase domain protein [Tetrahymena thermophila SB210]|eukprot:XP_012655553.1 kinase domain protein [Tetrahymena thermophila SB210]
MLPKDKSLKAKQKVDSSDEEDNILDQNIKRLFIDLIYIFKAMNSSKNDKKLDPLQDSIGLLLDCQKQKQNLLKSIKDLIFKYLPQNQLLDQIEQTLFDCLIQLNFNQAENLINYLKELFELQQDNLKLGILEKNEQDLLENLKESIDLIKTQTKKQIVQNQVIKNYNLSEINVLNCPKKCYYSSFQGKKLSLKRYIKYNDNKITFISCADDEAQYYFDFEIEFDKKYTLLLQFDKNPQKKFTIGVSNESLLLQRVAYDEPNSYFSKTFYPEWQIGNKECSYIIKGAELSFQPKIGQIIELRISLSQNLIEFADYPKRQNINTNFQDHQFVESQDRYVIGLNLCNEQQVSILQMQEVMNFIY